MLDSLNKFLHSQQVRRLGDPRNIGLYIFGIIVLAITWSGIKTVESNYQLQKKISTIQQENTVMQLQNENTDLQNQYLQTDQYLELAARQNFGLAAPGEKVLILPKSVALKYTDPAVAPKKQATDTSSPAKPQSKYVRNIEDWRDFLLGRKLFSR